MTRLFLPLFLLILSFFLALLFGLDPAINFVLKEKNDQYRDTTTRGLFSLIQHKLKGVAPSEHFTFLEQYNHSQKGYPMLILQQGDDRLSAEQWQSIKQGKLVSILVHEANYYFRWLPRSKLALGLTFELRFDDVVHRDGIQTFELIYERLMLLPETQWKVELAEIAKGFSIPLQLQRIDQVEIEEDSEQQIQQGKIVRTSTINGVEQYYGLVPGSNFVLVAGPIQPPITLAGLFASFVGVISLIICIGLFIWIRPLWRSIRDLKYTVSKLGEGDMDVRSSIKPKSSLGDLAMQINTMADQIQTLIKGHRDLTNAVSHELRTPIARMRFGMQMLSDNNNKTDQQRYVKGLNEDVDELEQLVDEILTYARYERGTPDEKWQTHNLSHWLPQVIEISQRFGQGKQIALDTATIPATLDLEIRPRSLQRAIENILRNACRYARQRIEVSVGLEGDFVDIHIDDDGPGIDKDKYQQVFEPFSRLEKSREKAAGGYGLGLAIAKNCIQSMHGNISIDISPMHGARFTIRLPMRNTNAA